MSATTGPDAEESLLRHAEQLVAGLRGGHRELPDVPALEGELFRSLLGELDEPTVDGALRALAGAERPVDAEVATLGVGDRIGTVRLEANLGEGGMGRVFRGFDEKLGRALAVKTIRSEARLSSTARARFRREARLLSRLNHPAICQVFDLVERPEADYLLIELVEGETLRAWIERRPARAERLEAAIAIAEAVAAAHRAGVIHRDLKPDNVMRTAAGGIKVLDFGIARADDAAEADGGVAGAAREGASDGRSSSAIAADEEAPTRFRTALGSVVGTPAYMSPEQVRGEAVQPASDVWALGVLFHELFAGSRPLASDRPTLRQLPEPEIRIDSRLDREPARLLGEMLAADPLSRPTAESVAERLRRIAARPTRRRRRTLAALAVVVTILGVARYVVDVRAQRTQAVAARAEAEEVVDFLVSLFEVSDPSEALGESITARELLARGSARLGELEGQPLVRARLEATVGTVYQTLGLYEESAPHLERALEARRILLGPAAPETLATGVRWAELEYLRGHVAEAEAGVSDVIELARALEAGHPRDGLLVEALDLRGSARRWLGELDAAEADKREALALVEATSGADGRAWAEPATGLAMVLRESQHPESAEPLARRALEILERELPESHPTRHIAMNNYALVLTDLDRNEEALEILRAQVELNEKTLGAAHPDVGVSLDNLAIALFRLGRVAEAETHVRRAVEIFSAAGVEHTHYLATGLHNLGVLAREQGRFEESVASFEQAIAIYREKLGARNPSLSTSLKGLAAVHERQDRPAEAAVLLEEALSIDEEIDGAGSPSLVGTLCRLARAHGAQGRLELARASARRALAIAEAAWGAEDPQLAGALETLADVLESGGRGDEALAVRQRRAALAAD